MNKMKLWRSAAASCLTLSASGASIAGNTKPQQFGPAQSDSLPTAMDTRRAAEFLGLSPSTLNKMRVYGGGPKFRKLGRRIIYTPSDLIAWRDERASTSTTDSEGLPRRLRDPLAKPPVRS